MITFGLTCATVVFGWFLLGIVGWYLIRVADDLDGIISHDGVTLYDFLAISSFGLITVSLGILCLLGSFWDNSVWVGNIKSAYEEFRENRPSLISWMKRTYVIKPK